MTETEHAVAGREQSQSPEVIAAYEEKARGGFAAEDPRDHYTYMISKMHCDYTLLDAVGVAGKHVLNVGCSYPVDEIYFGRKVERWTSIDISRESLKLARSIVDRELHPEIAARFAFEYADVSELPYPDATFDLAVALSTIDHLPSAEARQSAVDEMARTTKPGGHVVITVPNRWNLPYRAGIRKMTREKTLHYGFAYLFSPTEIRRMGRQAGLQPIHFASSVSPPNVWLQGYPLHVRYPARAVFGAVRLAGYFGRRMGYAFVKP